MNIQDFQNTVHQNKQLNQLIHRQLMLHPQRSQGKKELLPCVKSILETGVGEGSRNNTLSILSSAVLQSGYTLEETIDLMHDWNTNNEPPLPDREIEITVRSSYSMLLVARHYGCRAMKEYGYCIEDCKLRKEGN